ALLYSTIGILVYIAWRFEWKFSTGAVIATIHDVVVTLGLFSILGLEFDLTVLAAVLALIGKLSLVKEQIDRRNYEYFG
ncbi:MAG: protein translocase subunit SecF, partial [Pseudomonadota bacterium]